MQTKSTETQKYNCSIKELGEDLNNTTRSVIFSTFSNGDNSIFLANTSKIASFKFNHSIKFQSPLKFPAKPSKTVKVSYLTPKAQTGLGKIQKVAGQIGKCQSFAYRKNQNWQKGDKKEFNSSNASIRIHSMQRNSNKLKPLLVKSRNGIESTCLTINRLVGFNKNQQRDRKKMFEIYLGRNEKDDPDYFVAKSKIVREYLTENSFELLDNL